MKALDTEALCLFTLTDNFAHNYCDTAVSPCLLQIKVKGNTHFVHGKITTLAPKWCDQVQIQTAISPGLGLLRECTSQLSSQLAFTIVVHFSHFQHQQ
jgi:hypothetical protein